MLFFLLTVIVVTVAAWSPSPQRQRHRRPTTVVQPRPHHHRRREHQHHRLQSSSRPAAPRTQVPSQQQQQEQQQGQQQQGPNETPLQFEKPLLDTMQQALLLLEKRVSTGSPLTVSEAHELRNQLDEIANEMKVNRDKPLMLTQKSPPTIPAVPVPPPKKTSQQLQQVQSSGGTNNNQEEHNDEEGAAFDGSGGMGQPRGTVNTYVIDGMDEMGAEEYRDALQQSVLDRQAARKAAGKVTGNRSAWDYLNHLTGESGVLTSEAAARPPAPWRPDAN